MAKRKYSLLRVIRALAGENVDIGFEREISKEMEKQTHRSCDHGGVFIPDAALMRSGEMLGVDNVDGHIAGDGRKIVAEDILFAQFIEALTAKTVFGKAGVTVLTDLVGDVDVPGSDAVDAEWVDAEDGSAAKKNPTFMQLKGSPHTIAAHVDLSRKLMVQAGLDVEKFVEGLLQNAIARGVEKAGFRGTGSSGQPLGIDGTTGVQTVSMVAGAPTKAAMVEFWSKMETENADTEAAKFIMSPACKGLLSRTLDVTTIKNTAGTEIVGGVTAGRYLCEDGKCEDYPVLMSNLCDPKKIIFADWAQLMMLMWRGTEIIVDPYSLSTKGGTRVVAFHDVDFIVRQPKAFVIGQAIA